MQKKRPVLQAKQFFNPMKVAISKQGILGNDALQDIPGKKCVRSNQYRSSSQNV